MLVFWVIFAAGLQPRSMVLSGATEELTVSYLAMRSSLSCIAALYVSQCGMLTYIDFNDEAFPKS